jgi:hypothetical protein
MDKNTACYTIKEILDGTFVGDESCNKKIARMNRILANFFTDLVETQRGTVAECFSGSWEIKIVTKYPIRRVHGFYGEWHWPCFQNVEWTCDPCYRCDNIKQMVLLESPYYTKNNSYRINGENEIILHIDCPVKNGYFVYARGPKRITSLSDEICVEPQVLIGLQSLIEVFYTTLSDELNKSQLIEQRYAAWLTKARELKDYVPYAITRAYLTAI